jgi:hypothetical protein
VPAHVVIWIRRVPYPALLAPLAAAQSVKISPLGSHTGELCDRDRATPFKSPSGVRILYGAGHSVTGAD